MFYDRKGRPVTLLEFAGLFDGNAATRAAKRRVARTILPNGRLVSTVFLGLNHGFGGGPPLIFETMVFPNEDDFGELDCDRYSTEAEAVAGHAAMVEKWR